MFFYCDDARINFDNKIKKNDVRALEPKQEIFLKSIENGRMDHVLSMIKFGDVNFNKFAVIKKIDMNADHDYLDAYKADPIFLAISFGQVEIAKALYSNGFSFDKGANIPYLKAAIDQNNSELIVFLRDCGVDFSTKLAVRFLLDSVDSLNYALMTGNISAAIEVAKVKKKPLISPVAAAIEEESYYHFCKLINSEKFSPNSKIVHSNGEKTIVSSNIACYLDFIKNDKANRIYQINTAAKNCKHISDHCDSEIFCRAKLSKN